MWLFYAFVSAISAALVTIVSKMGLQTIDSTLATTIRAIIMALLLIIASMSFGKFNNFSLSTFNHRDWLLIALAGVAGAISWLFYFLALKSGTAGKVAAIDRLSLAFIVLLSALLLGESLTWRTITGTAIMIVGALLVTLK